MNQQAREKLRETLDDLEEKYGIDIVAQEVKRESKLYSFREKEEEIKKGFERRCKKGKPFYDLFRLLKYKVDDSSEYRSITTTIEAEFTPEVQYYFSCTAGYEYDVFAHFLHNSVEYRIFHSPIETCTSINTILDILGLTISKSKVVDVLENIFPNEYWYEYVDQYEDKIVSTAKSARSVLPRPESKETPPKKKSK